MDKIEEAKKLLMEEEDKRRKDCLREIDEVLKKYGYGMVVQNNLILVPRQQAITSADAIKADLSK